MKIIDNIFTFLKNLFNKKDDTKMLEATSNKEMNIVKEDNNFKESLKNNVVKKKKREVETLICHGTGLGISNNLVKVNNHKIVDKL